MAAGFEARAQEVPPAKIAVPGKFAKNGGEQSGRDGPKKQTNGYNVIVHGVTWAMPREGERRVGNGMM